MRVMAVVAASISFVACAPMSHPCPDADGDGVADASCGGADCDDADAAAHPGAAETCNGRDDDCDGRVDDGPLTWCVAHAVGGEFENSELGFRFSAPLDVNADGVPDTAAGARDLQVGSDTLGYATVFSGVSGTPLWRVESMAQADLFGQVTLVVPDLDGNGTPDVVIAAPQHDTGDGYGGRISARDGATGRELWAVGGHASESLGWHMALAHDGDGDGVRDLWAGEAVLGAVHLLSGRTGGLLLRVQGGGRDFGWYVDGVPDVDQDGVDDVIIGIPGESPSGAAALHSGRTGALLRTWTGSGDNSTFGVMVAGLPDIDGDGAGDVAVGEPYHRIPTGPVGEAWVYSGARGDVLFHWQGTEPGDLFGRMVCGAGDVDRDGVEDIAVGVPWWGQSMGVPRAGRVEIRSGRDGTVLLERLGTEPAATLGWHMAATTDLDGRGAPGMLVGALLATWNGAYAAGRIDRVFYGR